MKKNTIVENLEITDIVVEGKGLGRVDDFVIFVENAIVGDIVNVKIIKKKTNYAEAIIEKFIKYSPYRISARCKHFGLCGGCRWQNIDYTQQLHFKQKIVKDNFERIAKVDINDFRQIIAANPIFEYRNKLEYTFSKRRWLTADQLPNREQIDTRALGFHLPRMYDRVIDIEECFLQQDITNQIRNSVKDFARQHNLDFADTRTHEGFLRNLIVRNTHFTNQLMVIVVFGYEDTHKINLLMNYIAQSFPQINSLIYFINSKPNDNLADLEYTVYKGDDYITEKLMDMYFRIGPKSFFQTNSAQAQLLYTKAIDLAALDGSQVVYDLYSGTGTITQLVSVRAKTVVGIEIIEDAVQKARYNALMNNISNVFFEIGEVEKIFNARLFDKYGYPDVVIVDPPRSGLHKNVIKTLLDQKPQRIVYISCNPATQARDIGLLSQLYTVEVLQPVDMFPHTFHIENIALLVLK